VRDPPYRRVFLVVGGDKLFSAEYFQDGIIFAFLQRQKGTGKWTVLSGLDNGAPVTLIAEAVFAESR